MIKIIHEREVTEAYELANTFTYWRDVYAHSIQNYYVLFCEGDLHIKQHLILDYGEGWGTESGQWLKTMFGLDALGGKKNYGITALIVMGNLTVDGSIINANGDNGAGLLVNGNVSAHNLIAGGSSIFITGTAAIEQCTYGHYNDGMLVIKGPLNCPIQINDDHHFDATGAYEFIYDSHEGDFDSEAEFGDEDVEPGDTEEIPKSLRPLLHKKIATWSQIFDTLINGEYISVNNQHQLNQHPYAYYQALVDEVIAKGGDSKPKWDLLKRVPEEMRTLALCQQTILFDPCNLQHVPATLIDADLCHLAISQVGNTYSESGGYSATLSYVPTELMTDALCRLHIKNCAGAPVCANIPDAIKTKDFCMYAIQQACFTLEDLPEAFETDEALILEIVKNSYDVYGHLPEELAIRPKFQIAGIIGGCFDDVQYALKSLGILDTLPQLLNAAIAERMSVADHLPGYAFTNELLEHARYLYGTLPEWQDIENKHSEAFWRYDYNPTYITEIENNIEAEARYSNAFEKVWRCFYTEEFLIRCIQYTTPYAAIDILPKDVFTPAIVAACRKYDKYRYYETYLQKFGF